MQNFQYQGPATRIIFGEGSAERLGKVAQELGMRRALFVTDPVLAQSPAACAAFGSLESAGLEVELFSDVVLDPTDLSVEAAAARYREVGADGIVALGGGSAMDTAKALGVLAAAGAERIAPFYFGGSATPAGLPPLICLPTTSGTGSEVTYIAIVTDSATERKLLVRHPSIAPSVAIVDPALCATMPPGLTAATGFDALSHALEAMTSTMSNPISDAHALDAIPRIARHLPRAVADGSDAEARRELAYASTVAGLAFLSGRLHLGHAVGHSLGAAYHLPHGLACIICMPAILEFIAEPCAVELDRIGHALDVGAREVPALVESLMRACKLSRLGEAIRSDVSAVPALVDHVLGEDRLIGLSRRTPSREDWAQIFARSM
jgi:alcohol dehydrogenase